MGKITSVSSYEEVSSLNDMYWTSIRTNYDSPSRHYDKRKDVGYLHTFWRPSQWSYEMRGIKLQREFLCVTCVISIAPIFIGDIIGFLVLSSSFELFILPCVEICFLLLFDYPFFSHFYVRIRFSLEHIWFYLLGPRIFY